MAVYLTIFIAYAVCGYRCVVATESILKKFYWALPIAAMVSGALAFAALDGYAGWSDLKGRFLIVALIALGAMYFWQFIFWGHFFRCVKCGTASWDVTGNNNLWRQCVVWCPNCNQPYVNGRNVSN